MTDPTDRPPLDLDAIRARADAATPGPWAHGDFDDFMGCGQVFTVHPDLMGGSIAAPSGDCYPRSGYDPQADMAFIANARHDIPALLAEVTALRADLDATKAAYDQAEQIVTAMHYAVCGDRISPEGVLPDVVNTVKQLRAELGTARAYLALHLSPECQHINAHSGCDETVVCKGRCWCVCHNEEATDG